MRLLFGLLFICLVSLTAISGADNAYATSTVCGSVSVPWPSPPDDRDCDGFSDGIETWLGSNTNAYIPNGTSPYAVCSETPALNDETAPYVPYTTENPLIPNPWPPDFNDDQRSTLPDATSFGAYFNTHQSHNSPGSRWDLNGDELVSLLDITKLGQFSSANCTSLNQPVPTPSTSRYMSSTVNTYTEGCSDGASGLSGSTIFDWGHPTRVNGSFGTIDYSGSFRDTGQILAAISNYIYGFWHCTQIGGPHMEVVLGLDNDYQPILYSGGGVASHGTAWGQLISQVNYYIDLYGYRSQVDAMGGIDAESSFDSAANTIDWATSYAYATPSTYYDFGSADGCLTTWTGNVTTMGSFLCAGSDWTEENVAQIAWKLNNRPFPYPEIYRRDGWFAAQWQALSVYSYFGGYGAMRFRGSLTQRRACNYVAQQGNPDAKCTTHTTDNSPIQGWQQLWWLLNRDSVTAGTLPSSSDITYE